MAAQSPSKRHPRLLMFLSASTWTQCGAADHKGTIDLVQQGESLWSCCPNTMAL